MKKRLLGATAPIIALAFILALAACEKKADVDAQIAELNARLLAAEAALEAAKGGNASAEQIQALETAVAEIAEQETRAERRRSASASASTSAATGSNQMDGVLAGFERSLTAFVQLTNRLTAGRISSNEAMRSPAMSEAVELYWQLQGTPRENFTDKQYTKRLELDAKFVATAEAFHALSMAAPATTAPAPATSTTTAPATAAAPASTQKSAVTFPAGTTVIKESAYESKGLTGHLTIPNGVITIGPGAFVRNQLTSVTIPNSVTTIGDGAFGINRLTSVIIPDSVTTIEQGAFYDSRLTSVTIGNGVTVIGERAFSANYMAHDTSSVGNQLTSVTIPNSVTTIGKNAFWKNKLTSVTIGNGVTTIEGYAFQFNQLTSVTIPNSVTTIGKNAFMENQLTSVTIGNRVTTIGEEAFLNNQLTSVTIPASVRTIGGEAFRGKDPYNSQNKQLTSVTFEGDNVVIDSMAWGGNHAMDFSGAGTYTRPDVWSRWTKVGGTTAAPATPATPATPAPAAQSENTGGRRSRDQSGQQQTQQAAPPPPPPAEDSGGRRRQR